MHSISVFLTLALFLGITAAYDEQENEAYLEAYLNNKRKDDHHHDHHFLSALKNEQEDDTTASTTFVNDKFTTANLRANTNTEFSDKDRDNNHDPEEGPRRLITSLTRFATKKKTINNDTSSRSSKHVSCRKHSHQFE